MDVDIVDETLYNEAFRNVLYTGDNFQVVLMTLFPGEEIGEEIHEDTTQFFRIEEGTGVAIINGVEIDLFPGKVVIVPPGISHNIIVEEKLRLYTIYSGELEHPPGDYQYQKP